MNKTIKRILFAAATVLAAAVVSYLLIGAVFKASIPEMFMTEEERKAAAAQSVSGDLPMRELTDVQLVPGITELLGAEDGSIAALVTTEGFDGDVVLRIGVAADGTISGISAVSHSETPEVGAMALQSEYLDGYLGADSPDAVDAYAGASFTSAAIREAVDRAIIQYKVVNGIEVEIPVDEDEEEEEVSSDPFADRPVIYITTKTEEPPAPEAGKETSEAVPVEGVSEFVTNDDGSVAVTVTTHGYDSDITFCITIAADGTVADIDVLSQKETPALGGKALKSKYLNTYKGVSSTDGVDAYTGASFTSKAIKGAVDKALDQWKLSQGMEVAIETAPDSEDILASVLAETLGDCEKLDVEPVSEPVKAVYHSDAGYGIYVENQGHYEGVPIKLLVWLDENGILKEIKVIEQNETEGYGANVFNEAYLNFYKGAKQFKTVPLDFIEGKMIDMYSGATDTSLSVFNMVDAASKQYAALS